MGERWLLAFFPKVRRGTNENIVRDKPQNTLMHIVCILVGLHVLFFLFVFAVKSLNRAGSRSEKHCLC